MRAGDQSAIITNEHEDCSTWDPCEVGKPESCPREPSRELRRKAQVGAWSALEVRQEGGGLRHYLDGEPVHCGEGLELQAIEHRDDDGQEYLAFLPHGRAVRYEASQAGKTIRAVLYAGVEGHSFSTAHQAWMRFRWPVRS